jgi:hypothetical protein
MKIQTLIVGACLTLASVTAVAEVYKWTDVQGNIHYGDRKPENHASVQLNIRAGKPSNPSTMAPPRQEAEPTVEDQASTDERNGNAGLTMEQRQANCDVARGNLQTIETNNRIRISENGEQRYLTPEEIESKRLEMQQLAAASCGDASKTGFTMAQ